MENPFVSKKVTTESLTIPLLLQRFFKENMCLPGTDNLCHNVIVLQVFNAGLSPISLCLISVDIDMRYRLRVVLGIKRPGNS